MSGHLTECDSMLMPYSSCQSAAMYGRTHSGCDAFFTCHTQATNPASGNSTSGDSYSPGPGAVTVTVPIGTAPAGASAPCTGGRVPGAW